MKFLHLKKILAGASKYALAHKLISSAAFVVLVGGGWLAVTTFIKNPVQTTYTLGTVTRGTIISSISGSGQISASRQLDVKSEVSGTVVYVGVKSGQSIKKGQLLVQIDSTAAQKTLRDAQNSLDSAKLSLEKLQAPATLLTVTQAQNALASAQDALTTSYADSTDDITGTFLVLPDMMSTLQDIVIGTSAGHGSQWNIDFYRDVMIAYDSNAQTYRDTAYAAYTAARKSYDAALGGYKLIGNNPDKATIEKMANETYLMVRAVSDAQKSMNSLMQAYSTALTTHNQTVPSVGAAAITALSTQITTTNTKLSLLASDTSSIKNGKQSVIEKQQSLAELTDGPNTYDLQSSQLSLIQRQNAVQDAQDTLAKYYVRAPFDGTVATVGVGVGDPAGSAAIVTLITPQQIAALSLNEVDVAKVAVGNKATLTFDAIDSLTLTGTVSEVDPVGTVSQGVVSYGIKITLDTQNGQIKPGMTVNASIQTAVHQDVLWVPSGAVKTQNSSSYVLVFTPALDTSGGTTGVTSNRVPKQAVVTTGISDDTNIEILSGLTEGEQIVIKTNASGTAAKTTTTTNNPTRGGFGGGAAIRL